MSVTVQDLIDSLPTTTSCDLPLQEGTGFEHPTSVDGLYVEPPLVGDAGMPKDVWIILVRAPAAVGKSALARYLAAKTSNPLWDLEEVKFGTAFFDGSIIHAYDHDGAKKMNDSIRRGETAVLMDSFDEALAGGDFAGFVTGFRDLCRLLKKLEPPGPVIALFGRDESMGYVEMLLGEEGIPYTNVAIDFFNEEGAKSFVDHVLDTTEAGKVRRHTDDYSRARDRLFDRFLELIGEDASWRSPETRSFLGYAPVLLALGNFLGGESDEAAAEVNYGDLFEELESRGSLTVWSLLRSVVESILTREERRMYHKVRELWDAAPQRGWFAPDRQCEALLGTPHVSVQSLIPSGIQADKEQLFESRVRTKLDDHPFLLSGAASRATDHPDIRFLHVAFRDFVLAYGLAEIPSALPLILQICQRPDFSPSPLLIRYVIDRLGAWVDDPNELVINQQSSAVPLSWFGPLVQSLSSGSATHSRSFLELSEHSNVVHGFFELDGRWAAVAFSDAQTTPIVIWGVARHIALVVPESTVKLVSEGVMQLGPHVQVDCERLVVDAPDVVVAPLQGQDGASTPSAEIHCSEIETRGHVRLNCHPRSALLVDCPNSGLPWSTYAPRVREDMSSDLVDACQQLWGVVRWFRVDEKKSGYRWPRRPLDTALAKGKTSKSMFDYCLQRGVVTKDEGDYVLELAQANISRSDVYARDSAEPGLRAFLTEYLGRE